MKTTREDLNKLVNQSRSEMLNAKNELNQTNYDLNNALKNSKFVLEKYMA